jgi:von Willebrand factor type A domain
MIGRRHMTKHISIAIALMVASGCAGRNSLRLTIIESSVQRPSNIAMYFTVETAAGEPVPGLTAEQFRIYEDDQPVSVLESKQTILNPEVAANHYTLLLVDMSGSVTESGDVPVIVDASRAFADRVQKYQKVALYAFDGGAQIYPISGFSSGPAAASGADRLGSFRSRDPSTNLNGAIVEAVRVLDRQMRSSSVPLTFGTLVVFTDGTDRAHRVPRDRLHETLDHLEIDIITIGVGAEIDGDELESIGRNGAIVSKDRAQIASSFDAAAARVEAFSKRYYLLGYCSPARAGQHVVRVETTANGKTGSAEYTFNANGFGPNCDPDRPPSFNIRRPRKPPSR